MEHVSFPLYRYAIARSESVYSDLSFGVVINAVLFFMVLFTLYILIRRVTKAGRVNAWSRHLRIVEKIPMGSLDRYILISELQGVFYILYIDKNGATLIDKRDDLNIEAEDSRVDFQSILSKWVSKKDKEQDGSDVESER